MGKQVDFSYDEDDSLKYIRQVLPQAMNAKFSDDDIYYIVDLIYEYYERNGFTDEQQGDDEVFIDEDEILEFVIKNAKRDEVGKFTKEEISAIIQGELDYCDTLDLFD